MAGACQRPQMFLRACPVLTWRARRAAGRQGFLGHPTKGHLGVVAFVDSDMRFRGWIPRATAAKTMCWR